MKFFVVLAILAYAAAEECSLPEYLVGHWDSSKPGWGDLTATNTTLFPFTVTDVGKPLHMSCFLHNGTSYVLQSQELNLQTVLTYNYYICLDIEPSDDADFVYFRVRTKANPKHGNESFRVILSNADDDKTIQIICDEPANELPVGYGIFVKKGYEDRLGNKTCPSDLHAEFSANFTDQDLIAKCPEGFLLDGCEDYSHVVFNYTSCGGGANGLSSTGSPNYTCLTSKEKDDVIYTFVVYQDEPNPQENPYHYACLTQEKEADGTLTITKSAGQCGGNVSVEMTAEEILSCLAPTPTTETPSTTEGSEHTNTSHTPSPTTQGPGNGGDGDDGNSSGTASWGMLSLLLPAWLCVLAAARL